MRLPTLNHRQIVASVLAVVLVALVLWRADTIYNQAIGRADAAYQQYQTQSKLTSRELAQEAAAINAQTQTIALLKTELAQAQQESARAIARLQAATTPRQVVAAAPSQDKAQALPNGEIAMPAGVVKVLLEAQAQLPVVRAENQTLTAESAAQAEQIAGLGTELSQVKAEASTCKQAATAYRRVVHHSLLHRIGAGAFKVGIFIAGVAIGREL
ncbi:MAG: hypothetical protein ACRD2H_05830 [Terriglobales bacterium]